MISRTRFVTSSITLALAAGLVLLAAEDKSFRAGAATSYAHQQSENVTVGAKPYNTDAQTTEAFGKKADFAKYGVLPLLLVIENRRSKALDLRNLEVSLVAADGRHAAAVSADELPFLATNGKHPSQNPVHVPIPLPKKKNPMNAPEIAARQFSAKVIAPGDSASGFFYFEAKAEAGDRLYLNGMKDARSGQELLYFEFPLDSQN